MAKKAKKKAKKEIKGWERDSWVYFADVVKLKPAQIYISAQVIQLEDLYSVTSWGENNDII